MQAMTRKLLVLGMGGTIAGRSEAQGDNVGYRAGEVPVDALLPVGIDSLACLAGVQIETSQVAQIDSKDMDHPTWFELARTVIDACMDDAVLGVVITHGTDTVEETAFFLADLCAPRKPVVLTCAMRPSTAVSADGPQNVLDAVCVAMDARSAGVWLVASGAVHAALHVAKVHPYRVDAFTSGEGGPVAVVEEGWVRWLQPVGEDGDAVSGFNRQTSGCISPAETVAPDALHLLESLRSTGLPRIEWVVSHAGVTPSSVKSWLVPCDGAEPVRGLVLVCTGNGTFHQCLTEPLREAEAAGVAVWRTTRCTSGQIVEGRASLNWPFATPLSPVKARIALALWIARQDARRSASAQSDSP